MKDLIEQFNKTMNYLTKARTAYLSKDIHVSCDIMEKWGNGNRKPLSLYSPPSFLLLLLDFSESSGSHEDRALVASPDSELLVEKRPVIPINFFFQERE